MKDTRFTELLNLYIDRQISEEETAELEAEIQASPQRRQVYRQYCQMHRATKLVYESFRAGAAQPAASSKAGSIARFESRQRTAQRNRWIFAAAGLAAACFTVVLVRMNRQEAPSILQQQPQATLAVTETQAAPQPLTAEPAVSKPATAADYSALLAVLRQQEQQSLMISQQHTGPVRLQPLFDDGVFDSRQLLPPGQNGRRLQQTRNRGDQRAQAEFTAFQFQR